ncbi:FAD-dependent oxidoreductase, partial [bacterium]
MKPDVVVVGAGAAGIFAAWRAASLGAKVVLVEKTARIGTKISISGGGKCNVAHAGPIEDVLKAFRPNEARFIRPACYRLKNDAIVKLMTDRGLRVYTRDDDRVFPIDQTAKDVVAILRGYLDDAGVEVRLETPVEEILATEGKITGVKLGRAYTRHGGYKNATYGAKALLNEVLTAEPRTPARLPSEGDGLIECPRVILATGGSSYPNSGTTGDGWPWVSALGHTVVKVRAALAPVYLRLEEKHVERSGIALRSPVLRARLNGKEIVKWQADLLFTHQGISGPAALGISPSPCRMKSPRSWPRDSSPTRASIRAASSARS